MKTTFTFGDNIIDSQDIIARYEELVDEQDSLISDLEDALEEFNDFRDTYDSKFTEVEERDFDDHVENLEKAYEDAKSKYEAWMDDNEDELNLLKNVNSDGEGYIPDWKYGVGLIHADYFKDFAQDLANDIGAYDARDVVWPHTCIDWEQAAEELKQDYTVIECDGETYYAR